MKHHRVAMPDKPIAWLREPDVLCFAQYHKLVGGKALRLPERDLMIGILGDAIGCFQQYAGKDKRRRLFDESEEWIHSDERDYVFSFNYICWFLGIDPEYLRKGLAEWKAKELRRRERESGAHGFAPYHLKMFTPYARVRLGK